MNHPTVITASDRDAFDFGGLGVVWKLDGPMSDGRFAVVHHPIAPRALAAPLHYHHNEDEYSYVFAGTLGALLGDSVVHAEPGTWVVKPRHQWHTFWNAGDTQCEIIEVISPAGFENYFREVACAWGDLERLARINQNYALDMDFESVSDLCRRFGLTSRTCRQGPATSPESPGGTARPVLARRTSDSRNSGSGLAATF